jgi:hypothetical protein
VGSTFFCGCTQLASAQVAFLVSIRRAQLIALIGTVAVPGVARRVRLRACSRIWLSVCPALVVLQISADRSRVAMVCSALDARPGEGR